MVQGQLPAKSRCPHVLQRIYRAFWASVIGVRGDNDRASMLNDDRYEQAPCDPSGRVSAQRELLEWYTSRPHAHDLPLGGT